MKSVKKIKYLVSVCLSISVVSFSQTFTPELAIYELGFVEKSKKIDDAIDFEFCDKVFDYFLTFSKGGDNIICGQLDFMEFFLLKKFIQKLQANQNTKEHISYLIFNEIGFNIVEYRYNDKIVSFIKSDIDFLITKYRFSNFSGDFVPVFWEQYSVLETDELKFIQGARRDSKLLLINICEEIKTGPQVVDSVIYKIENKILVFYYDKNYYAFINEFSDKIGIEEKLKLPIDSIFIGSIIKNFEHMSEGERMSIYFDLCKSGIEYRSDISYKDEWLLPEQTIVRGYGDCEDKSILLSLLISIFRNEEAYIILYGQSEFDLIHVVSAYRSTKSEDNKLDLSQLMYLDPSDEGYNLYSKISNKFTALPFKKAIPIILPICN